MSKQLYDVEHKGVHPVYHRPSEWEPFPLTIGLDKVEADTKYHMLVTGGYTTLMFRIVPHKPVGKSDEPGTTDRD